MGVRAKKISILLSNDLVTDQRMKRIGNALIEQGFDVLLIGRKRQFSLPLINEKFSQSRLKLWFNSGPLFYLELNFRLFIYLLFNKPDIVYVVDADTALAGVFFKSLFNRPLIFDSHELFSEVPELYHRNVIKLIWRRMEKWVILKADLRITVSESIAKHYFKTYYQPFRVIRNLPYRYRSLEKINPGEKYILYQGALNNGRGLEELIEAAKNINIPIKICGDGDLFEPLKQLARNQTNIEFLGQLTPENLLKITQNAWLGYNLLSEISLSYQYSLSNKTFDYIQASVPQLVSNFPEYIKLNDKWQIGWLIDLNATAISKKVNELLENLELYYAIKNDLYHAAKALNWENEQQKLFELFEPYK